MSYALSSTACRRRGYLDTTTRRHPPPPSELKSKQQKLSREAHPLPFEETTTGQSDPPFPCHFTSMPKQTHLPRDAHRPALPPFPSHHPSRGQPINAASSDSPAPPSACLPCASPLGSTRPYRLSPRPRGPTPALLLPHHFKSHHHPRCPQTVTRSTLGLAALRTPNPSPSRLASAPPRPTDRSGRRWAPWPPPTPRPRGCRPWLWRGQGRAARPRRSAPLRERLRCPGSWCPGGRWRCARSACARPRSASAACLPVRRGSGAPSTAGSPGTRRTVPALPHLPTSVLLVAACPRA